MQEEPKKQQLLALILPCGMYDIHFRRHVVIHKIRQRFLVCDDAPDLCCCQKNIIRLLCCKKIFHILLSAKIQFLMSSCYQYCDIRLFPARARLRSQPCRDVLPHKFWRSFSIHDCYPSFLIATTVHNICHACTPFLHLCVLFPEAYACVPASFTAFSRFCQHSVVLCHNATSSA